MSYHEPALLKESVDALNIQPGGIYVDVTYGGGGHSKEILRRLDGKGRLIAFDQDEDAKRNVVEDERLAFVQQNFKYLKRYMRLLDAIPIDGLIADLGVSSHQFDTAERGFSLRFEGELDMRMDKEASLSAKEVVNQYSAEELQRVLGEYGEVRNARTLAHAIVEARTAHPIETTEQLKDLALNNARGDKGKYLAQVFQAIRIEVNAELESLKTLLEQSGEVMREGGRLVVITYHSLEDRLVKNYMRNGNFSDEPTSDIYGRKEMPYQPVNKKPIEPSAAEVKRNPRVRSARLRIAEKT